MPKLEKVKSENTFGSKKKSVQEKLLKSDLKVNVTSTVEISGVKDTEFFMTQPNGEPDSIYHDQNGYHSLYDPEITEDMISQEGDDYRDVGMAAKVHAAHLES